MKSTSISKFRKELSSNSQKSEAVILTSYGKMVGCYMPLTDAEDIPIKLKREFTSTLGKQIAKEFSSKKATEKSIINDFKKFKLSR